MDGSEDDNFYLNLWNNANSRLPMFTYRKSTSTDPVWSSQVYENLESMRDLGMTKTIYDPSPVGYEVPVIDAFAALTAGGVNYDGGSYPDIHAEFYTTSIVYTPGGIKFTDNNGRIIKIGAFGYKSDENGAISEYGNYGGVLTSNPICVQWSNNNAADNYLNQYFLIGSSRLYFEIGNIKNLWPIASSSFAHAFPVISAKTGVNPQN